jgi:hypothetical protein
VALSALDPRMQEATERVRLGTGAWGPLQVFHTLWIVQPTSRDAARPLS